MRRVEGGERVFEQPPICSLPFENNANINSNSFHIRLFVHCSFENSFSIFMCILLTWLVKLMISLAIFLIDFVHDCRVSLRPFLFQ